MPTIEEIQASIDNTSFANDSIDFVTLAAQSSQATNYLSFCSVKTIDMLPDLSIGSLPNGSIVYVDEIGGPVLASNKNWLSLDGSVPIRKDGSCKTASMWGYNDYAQLGIGKGGYILSPTDINIDFCSFSISQRNSAGVTPEGCVYTVGCNDNGQLGNGICPQSLCECSAWTRISDSTLGGSWCKIASTLYNTYMLTTDGKVYGMGGGSYGMSGNPNSNPTCLPTEIFWLNGAGCCWSSVFAGNYTLFTIKPDGSLFASGENSYGKLGVGDTCSCNYCARQVPGIWRQIYSHSTQTHGVATNGALYTWGRNYHQSLGLGCGNGVCVLTPALILGGGTSYCGTAGFDGGGSAVKTDGTIWVWGYNNSWALGIGCCNGCCFSSPIQVAGGKTDWCAVTGTYYGFAALTTDGRMWGWGANSFGQVGDGTQISRCSPVTSLGNNTWISLAESNDGQSYHMMARKVS